MRLGGQAHARPTTFFWHCHTHIAPVGHKDRLANRATKGIIDTLSWMTEKKKVKYKSCTHSALKDL